MSLYASVFTTVNSDSVALPRFLLIQRARDEGGWGSLTSPSCRPERCESFGTGEISADNLSARVLDSLEGL